MKTLTGMGGMGGARELAEMLRQMGRGPDTMLAHITPEEAEMLMRMGGSGQMNPNTGLPEFQPDYGEMLASERPMEYEGPDVPFNFEPTPLPPAPLPSQYQGPDVPFDFTQQAPVYDPGMDIGFGPGEFMPQVQRADISGMPTEQFQRFMGEPEPSPFARLAGGIEERLQGVRDVAQRYPTLSRILQTGAASLPAMLQASRARREGARSAEELRSLGRPLREQGEALRQQALSGGLTPQQAAAQEAARARLRQGAATRGVTTGTQQAMIENQLASSRAAQSEINLNNALKQLNLANAYDEAAIRAKLASDREIADSLSVVYQNLARNLAGQPSQQPQAAAPRAPAVAEAPVTRRPDVRG